MFYGSDERETAVAEIDDDPGLGIAVGTFQTMRDATILDLTRLPKRVGFFEQQSDASYVNRYTLEFLHRFVKSLAAKVEPGAQEHIDYVPTQVVTEWFRTRSGIARSESTAFGTRARSALEANRSCCSPIVMTSCSARGR
jgi:hypothetical protein